MPKDNYYI